MPGCAAVGCNNRSEKGYIMKCFPRDPTLRKIWQERVARADWEPSNNSFLCHVHFEPEEWSITQSGRIRLKKNAVPTIFTITSTRKSPKKRIKLSNLRNETIRSECENDYITEYLENDTEHSSTGNLEEKDSDSQGLDDPSVPSFIYRQVSHSPTMTENKQVLSEQYRAISSDIQQESIILISKDNNMLENSINDHNNGKQMRNNLTQNQNKNVAKTGMKGETDQVSLDDSYDEIEEKLKQICNGYREENMSNNVEKLNSIARNQKRTLEQSAMQVPFHKNINYKYSSKNTIGNILTDNAENIEIIFGSESGEECVHVSKYTSNNVTNENDKLNQHNTDINNITDKQNDKTCLKETEEYFNKEHSHVTSNMRAAMKRKWRTREEIMKSVKKSIRTVSSQDTVFVSNSDASDNNVEVEDKIEKELNTPESIQFDKDDTTQAKFTIKVTGEREDVIDIMQDLFKDTKDFTIQEHNNMHVQGNDTLVTSVITIDDCTQVRTNAKNERNHDILQSSITDIKPRSNDHVSCDFSTLKNNECLGTRLIPSHFNEESDDIDISSDCLSLDINKTAERATAIQAIRYDYQKLQQKVKMQEDVIRKLTNQLILYKDLEKDLKSKTLALEIKTMCEYDTKTDNGLFSASCKKNMDSRQTLINDLSNRISYFLDMNKKLMRTITMECQQKRELEGQIKQKDNLIKELNWKLQKASKFFDRAVKNVNTCKRKMLNMQTVMRRRKLLDEKLSHFNEMLIDNVKGGYSERAQAMAMEIKNICGENGYNKLLSFGFPLPALSTLQISLRDNSSNSNESSNEISTAISSKHNVDEKHMEYDGIHTKNGIMAHSKNHVGRPKTVREEIILDSIETVTGTVQDIFEENNDIDDFTTIELRDHFISELNATM
ncbi:putative leucine-rich repeat-containing protein DDB_G0290503 [Linepithema humile]|uniref:putative leucine-rich repeat-containing protein DDB_G0290503 n=1 Tax=Linepithema humile TaxID=83485 RepID=UPI000623108A|nr:PREDICTED: uncharacterized protein LOC105674604 [Linepithema humile]